MDSSRNKTEVNKLLFEVDGILNKVLGQLEDLISVTNNNSELQASMFQINAVLSDLLLKYTKLNIRYDDVDGNEH